MDGFTMLESIVVPVDRANVDTDAIIPKQFMKSIRRTGFGENLFDEWRYLDRGEPGQDCRSRPRNETFTLNQPRFAGAQILLTRANFGCGSSREHAVWALHDHGIRCVIAPSFAEIFHGNCLKNGILPVVLPPGDVDALFAAVNATPGFALRIDLQAQTVSSGLGHSFEFPIDDFKKTCLLQGLDDIALTLQRTDEVRRYEQARKESEPWLFEARQFGTSGA